MQSFYDWASANPAQRKFVTGEQILEAGHTVKYAKNTEKYKSVVSYTDVCLQMP